MLGVSNIIPEQYRMKISSLGKFLDQPLLSNTLAHKMPLILTTAALGFGIKDTLQQPQNERKKRAVKNTVILSAITLASLLGAKLIKIKGKSLIETVPREKILLAQQKAIEEFKNQNSKLCENTVRILDKAKEKMLSLKETDTLLAAVKDKKGAEKITNTLFGNKEDITSKKIVEEISGLSIMGFIPVASGVAGGVAADKLTNESSGEKTKNKIKEGIYQFFANIFLCNVGAGTFLYTAEKLNEKGIIKNLTPLKKTGIILSGILSVGVIGGSRIANIIGNKFVNPVIDKCGKNGAKQTTKNEERKPEALDIALHTDDIATAGVLSGVKWIEPLLPVMYLVSGYRTAIGYRNGDNNCACAKAQKLDKAQNHNHN